jgi:hypothetical protein
MYKTFNIKYTWFNPVRFHFNFINDIRPRQVRAQQQDIHSPDITCIYIIGNPNYSAGTQASPQPYKSGICNPAGSQEIRAKGYSIFEKANDPCLSYAILLSCNTIANLVLV